MQAQQHILYLRVLDKGELVSDELHHVNPLSDGLIGKSVAANGAPKKDDLFLSTLGTPRSSKLGWSLVEKGQQTIYVGLPVGRPLWP